MFQGLSQYYVTKMSINIVQLFKMGRRGCGLTDLARTISTNELAEELFKTVGLLPFKNAKCKCGNRLLMKNKSPTNKTGFRWRCIAVGCGLRFNPLENTWFERSHLSYLQVNLCQHIPTIVNLICIYFLNRTSNSLFIGFIVFHLH